MATALPHRLRVRRARRLLVVVMLLVVLVQRGGSVNDASCLTRTRVHGVVRPRDVADVREALAFARKHDLTVSVAGTRHAMGARRCVPAHCSSRLPQYTDVLHEYLLPPDQLVPFLDELRSELGRHDAGLLSASIRSVHREDVAIDYAQGDRFSVVLYLSQRVSRAGSDDMADLTGRLVARTLARGGTFYLPYQPHYTATQVREAYPGFDAFVATKRGYDPDLRFRNSLWDRFAG